MSRSTVIAATLLSLVSAAGADVRAADGDGFHFKSIQVDDGLSENAVYCVLQDSTGFMWFGTKDGLNRYDGNTFRVFRKDDLDEFSLGNNFVRAIAQGADGILYVGTDAGLYRMEMADERFHQVDTRMGEPDGNGQKATVNALHIDAGGKVWIGTMAHGILRYDPETGITAPVATDALEAGPGPRSVAGGVGAGNENAGNVRDGAARNIVWAIATDHSGTTWAGTRSGLLRYNPQRDVMERVEGMFSPGDGSQKEILSMFDDEDGNLWLGSWDDGIRLYNKQTGECTSYHGRGGGRHYITHVRAIFQYAPRQLLVGSDDGLYLFDVTDKAIRRLDEPHMRYNLSDQNVYCIARDRENGIWIGTYFGGVNYMNTSLTGMETHHPGKSPGRLSGKAVSQFLEDGAGNMWIATEDGGLNYFDTATGVFTQPVPTSYHNVHSLMMDGGELWIGTFSRGIDVYDLRTHRIARHYRSDPSDAGSLDDDCIFSLYRTRSGDIYAGTPAGLNRFDRAGDRFVPVPEVRGFVYDVREDDYGNLWVASYGEGALRLDGRLDAWVRYDGSRDTTSPIVGAKLTSIHIDSRKRVIFSSEGRGIFIYDRPSDGFLNISEADGLPNDVIYGVLDDPDGNLWLSCNKGLVRLDGSSAAGYTLYNRDDGLQSNQFNYKSVYRSSSGKFYFGGINGFSCFYPRQMTGRRNVVVPPVAISSIRLSSRADDGTVRRVRASLNRGEKISLSHNHSSMVISFVSLSYVAPSKNRYAYMLDGSDMEWNDGGDNRSVTYENLPPGTYTFRVKASNNDGLWNERGAAVDIEIRPPWWASVPARTIYIVFVTALGWLIVMRLAYMYRARRRKHMDAIRSEQEKLAFTSKIEFFTTVAHEIRTPLSLICAPLEEITTSGDGSEHTRRNLAIIERNCERLRVLVDQLLDFRKMDSTRYVLNPETIDLAALMGELYESFAKTALGSNRGLELRLPPPGTVTTVTSDGDALTKIVGNLLTNAMKFTRHRIVLGLRTDAPGSYTISVEDDGNGIPAVHRKLIFDPFYQVHSEDAKRGSGIGLSLVKHLSEVLGGEVRVRAGEMGGALFEFTFPAIAPEPPDDAPDTCAARETHAGGSAEEAGERRSRVLVVDDNTEMSDFVARSLTPDYMVESAQSAREAMLMLGDHEFDLVVSDVMMPSTDGVAFVAMLRVDPRYSHIPVVLLSARTENEAKARGLLSGADVFIEKPFSMLHLKAQISSLLDNRRTMVRAMGRSPLAFYSNFSSGSGDTVFLSRLNAEIERHISDENFTVESLADTMSMSRSSMQRKVKNLSGVTPGDYLRNYRLQRACLLLTDPDARISNVAFSVGYASASYFTKVFMQNYNMSPSEFMHRQRNK